MQLYWREFQSHSANCFDCVNKLVRIIFPRCTVGVNQAIPWRQNDTGASMCDCSLSATEFEYIDWTFLTTCQILPTLTNTVGNIKKELFFVVMANFCRWWECFWSITLWYSSSWPVCRLYFYVICGPAGLLILLGSWLWWCDVTRWRHSCHLDMVMTSFCGHAVAQINAPLSCCVNTNNPENVWGMSPRGRSSLHVLKI